MTTCETDIYMREIGYLLHKYRPSDPVRTFLVNNGPPNFAHIKECSAHSKSAAVINALNICSKLGQNVRYEKRVNNKRFAIATRSKDVVGMRILKPLIANNAKVVHIYRHDATAASIQENIILEGIRYARSCNTGEEQKAVYLSPGRVAQYCC